MLNRGENAVVVRYSTVLIVVVYVADLESQHKISTLLVHTNDDHPVHTAVSGTDNSSGQEDQVGRWRVKGTEFSLTVDRRSKSRMLEDLRCVFYHPRVHGYDCFVSCIQTNATVLIRRGFHTIMQHEGTMHTCCDPEDVTDFFVFSFPAPSAVA